MNRLSFTFCDAALEALPSGALHWPEAGLIVVSDLHLGKCTRLSAQGGAALPPYDACATLDRLEVDVDATGARRVICLGDSFDTPEMGAALDPNALMRIARLQAGRDWIWIEGNHDPGPVGIGGTHLAEIAVGGLTFRHIATRGGAAELSGHYHPKARLALRGRVISRACFLLDAARMILPAYGAYTGGLASDHPVLARLMGEDARAILTGPRPAMIPMPR